MSLTAGHIFLAMVQTLGKALPAERIRSLGPLGRFVLGRRLWKYCPGYSP